MPHTVRSRVPVVFLILSLIALPAFAGEQGTPIHIDQGLLASFWQALTDLVSDIAQLGPGLAPLSAAGQEPNGSQGDLGPSLDPLG